MRNDMEEEKRVSHSETGVGHDIQGDRFISSWLIRSPFQRHIDCRPCVQPQVTSTTTWGSTIRVYNLKLAEWCHRNAFLIGTLSVPLRLSQYSIHDLSNIQILLLPMEVQIPREEGVRHILGIRGDLWMIAKKRIQLSVLSLKCPEGRTSRVHLGC